MACFSCCAHQYRSNIETVTIILKQYLYRIFDQIWTNVFGIVVKRLLSIHSNIKWYTFWPNPLTSWNLESSSKHLHQIYPILKYPIRQRISESLKERQSDITIIVLYLKVLKPLNKNDYLKMVVIGLPPSSNDISLCLFRAQ